MIKFWVTKIKYKLATIEDVSPWYIDEVKKELDAQGIDYTK